jgi:hypothetical protein
VVTVERFLSEGTEIAAGRSEVVVTISQAAVGVWALELTLLLERLADSLTVAPTQGGKLVLTVSAVALSRGERFIASRSGSSDTMKFVLPQSQAERLRAVLLRAYRDGMAETDHVHLEGTLNGNPYDLTPFFENSRPPMTAEEASKLLDD